MLRKIAGRGSGGAAGFGFVSMLALSGSGRRKPTTTIDTISHSPSSFSLANHCRAPSPSWLSAAQRVSASWRVMDLAYRGAANPDRSHEQITRPPEVADCVSWHDGRVAGAGAGSRRVRRSRRRVTGAP